MSSRWKEMQEAEERAAQAKAAEAEEEQQQSLEDVEEDFKETLTDAQKAFRERAAKEVGRAKDVTDANYYFTVWFSNYKQLEEFCDSFGLDSDEVFMDGREVARKLRRALKTPDMDFPKTQPINKAYSDRARMK